MAPVGGGGLLAGTALAVAGAFAKRTSPKRASSPPNRRPSMMPRARSAMGTSIHRRARTRSPTGCARSWATSISPSSAEHVSDIVTVSEQGIIDAMRLVWERMKIIVEPSSAVPVAALFEHQLSSEASASGLSSPAGMWI